MNHTLRENVRDGGTPPQWANPEQKRKVKDDQKRNRVQFYAKKWTLHDPTFGFLIRALEVPFLVPPKS